MRSPQPTTLPALSFQQTILPLLWAMAAPAASARISASAAAGNAREVLSMGRHSILFAIAADCSEVLRVARLGLEKGHQIIERRDADHRNIIACPYLLDGGQGAAAALHAVERDRHAAGYSVRAPNQVDRLAHGGAGRYDVVHDQHLSGKRRPDHGAALAVVLDLLAVEAVANAAALVGKRDGDRRHQRDAL